MIPKIIGKIKGSANINFDRKPIIQLLNLHFYGQINCNIVDEKTKSITPIEHINRKQLEKSHANIETNFVKTIEVDILETGDLINFRFKK
jgi:hypothetical protein